MLRKLNTNIYTTINAYYEYMNSYPALQILVPAERQWVLHIVSECVCVCVYKLKYPARNTHAPYNHVVWPALQYFSIFSHKWHDFRKSVTEHKIRVLIFCKFFVWNISHSTKKWARCNKNIYFGPLVKYPLFLSDFNETWIFEKSSNVKCHENLSNGSRVAPCGRTDMTHLIVAFRNFANAPKTIVTAIMWTSSKMLA